MRVFFLAVFATCLFNVPKASAAQGLTYLYYEGAWNSLPNFNSMTPVKTGVSNNIDLSLRNRDNSYAFLWAGTITIAAAGNYTFETNSDDGSKLYIGNSYGYNATALVTNEGLHGNRSASGTTYLNAGTYPFTVTYFQSTGNQTMEVYWSSNTGIPRQKIPDNVLSSDFKAPASSQGLSYSYFEGSWLTIPDYSTLTAVKTGTSNNVDLGVRARDNSYSILWQGNITIPSSGTYTFETNSDDGSKLYIGNYTASSTPLVNNDGLHGAAAATGTMYLDAGTYPITISYLQNSGNQVMEVYWSSTSGIARQRIPDNVLSNTYSVPPSGTIGLNYSYYEGSWTSLPDFTSLTPAKTGSTNNVNLAVRNRDNQYAITWQGSINIPTAGTYTFETNSDDGSRLFVGDYNASAPLVNNDGLHVNRTSSGSINLNAGTYPITISYFQKEGDQTMEVYWSSNSGIARQRIPDNAFRSTTNGPTNNSLPDPGGTGGLTGLTNYYFSSSIGDDSRTSAQAQNPATPWRSLNKLNSIMPILKPGDAVLFKRGDVFDGSITIKAAGTSNSPLIFSAYGSGSKPVINGFSTLSNWVSLGNGVWQSNCPSCETSVNMVSIDGVSTAMGRYPNADAPNSGYLTLESHTPVSITDHQLKGSWAGAELVLRSARWIIDRNPIISQLNNTLIFTPTTVYQPKDKWGYFIQNDPRTLDQFGEWYYEPNGKNLQVYFGSNNPNASVIKASSVGTLFTMQFISNVIFDNLSVQGSNTNSFDLNTTNNIQITNSDISYSGGNGVIGGSSNFFKMENCTITNSNNDALYFVYDCSNATVRNNTIKNTGIFAGMGHSGDGSYQAIQFAGSQNLIELNNIDNVGYTAITLNGDYTIVKNNVVNHFCMAKDDGGGIYSNSTDLNVGRQIVGNIVLNGVGAKDGAADSQDNIFSFGLYLDNNSHNIKVSDNTVANCNGAGVSLLDAHEIVFQNNTVYNNSSQLFMLHINGPAPFGNNSFMNNILFSRGPNQNLVNLISDYNDISNFATYDYNYYCRPLNDDNVIFINSPVDNLAFNLAQWKAAYGQDGHSQKSPFSLKDKDVNNIRFEYNPTSSSLSISLDGAYVDVKGNTYNGSVTLDPFTSVVLMKNPNSSIAAKDLGTNQKIEANKTSVIADTKLLSIDVSPNPVKDQMNIRVSAPQGTQKATIMIHSISGVALQAIPVTSGSQNISLDVSSWTRGSYIVNLVCDGRVISKTIVKL